MQKNNNIIPTISAPKNNKYHFKPGFVLIQWQIYIEVLLIEMVLYTHNFKRSIKLTFTYEIEE